MTSRPVAALLAVILAAACFSTTLPPLELYRLSIPEAQGVRPVQYPGGRPVLDGSIAIASYDTPGLYSDRLIVYRIGNVQYGQYPSRQWAMPLGQMLGQITERILASAPLANGAVMYDPPRITADTWIWRGTVLEFEEVNIDREVHASVALEARLYRPADDSVLWTGRVHRTSRVDRPTMPGIVASLSLLAEDAVQALALDAYAAISRNTTISTQAP